MDEVKVYIPQRWTNALDSWCSSRRNPRCSPQLCVLYLDTHAQVMINWCRPVEANSSVEVREKPKMFFLQACHTKSSSTPTTENLTHYQPDAPKQDADIFIANATTPVWGTTWLVYIHGRKKEQYTRWYNMPEFFENFLYHLYNLMCTKAPVRTV